MKKFDIVTALDICVDFLLHLGEVNPEFGQKEQIIRDYGVELGGSCCIFACQAAKLGLVTKGIGVAGQDSFGSLVLEKLGEAGVITEDIRRYSSIKTGMGAALCKDNGDRAILTYTGTIDGVNPEDFTEDILRNTRHIHIGSYFLMKRLQRSYPKILKEAKKWGAAVSIDTNWDPDESWDSEIEDIFPYTDIYFGNENEAKAISGKQTVSEAVKLLSSKIPVVVIKMGEKGAAVYAEGKEYFRPALKVDVVDTVGAGDSFDAGFVYGWLKGYDFAKCLEIACLCGSCSTTRAGGIEGQLTYGQLIEKIIL
ncbi:MAG TPA: sugar kinase [Clostridiales bacterium]|nr:sugar kinase [Clostridiales bacterium]